MAISVDDRVFLKTLYSRMKDEPLQPGSDYYEPVHEEMRLEDPVKKIATLIEFDGVESIRLFSGFRGSGKTTELYRWSAGSTRRVCSACSARRQTRRGRWRR